MSVARCFKVALVTLTATLTCACSAEGTLSVWVANLSQAPQTTLSLRDVVVRAQPHGAPLSVDWRRVPAQDRWVTALDRLDEVTCAPGETKLLGAITLASGSWQRIWLDVGQASFPALPALVIEDHSEPIALQLTSAQLSSGDVCLEVLTLPSSTTDGQWALFTAGASWRP